MSATIPAVPQIRRRQVIATIMAELRHYVDAVDAFETAVARRLGLDRRTLRWFVELARSQGMTVAELERVSGVPAERLAPLLDRLEAAGHVHRAAEAQPESFHASESARAMLAEALEPVEAAETGLHRYSAEELSIVRNFLRVGRRFYERQSQRFAQRYPDPPQ